MTEVDNIHFVLCCFLRALSVKVSRSTLSHLLDTPVGSSMRGISDALDALRIRNEVYQLPPTAEYFSQVEAPFITMLQVDKNPFRVVTKKTDSIVEFGNSERMSVDNFLKKWTGTVLFGETTEQTQSEKFHLWKDIFYYLSKYKVIIAILLVIVLGLFSSLRQNAPFALTAYLGTLAFGILVSVAIIYKEQFNGNFMERFCHIGKTVDCNTVLRSKGASIAGASLGELSLLYFGTLFLFSSIYPTGFYGIAFLCCAIAICFTLYSVVYQTFIIHKGCMLCMLVNITIWISAFILYNGHPNFTSGISLPALLTWAAIGCICLITIITSKSLIKEQQAKSVLQNRMATLLRPEVFQRLLPLERHIEKPITADIALTNQSRDDNRLMIVTNPNCKNCAKVHRQIAELSSVIPLSIVLLTFPYDKTGERVAQTVIAAYRTEGWHKAMQLLDDWFNKKQISEWDKYLITPEAERIWREQQEYCRKQGINQTPVTIAAGYYAPEVYSIPELRYVLT